MKTKFLYFLFLFLFLTLGSLRICLRQVSSWSRTVLDSLYAGGRRGRVQRPERDSSVFGLDGGDNDGERLHPLPARHHGHAHHRRVPRAAVSGRRPLHLQLRRRGGRPLRLRPHHRHVLLDFAFSLQKVIRAFNYFFVFYLHFIPLFHKLKKFNYINFPN